MILPEFEYLTPGTVEHACALLSRHAGDAKILAGGSDLIVKMKHGQVKPRYVVSLRCLDELRGVRREMRVGVIIGSRTTHNQVVADPILQQLYPSVCAAADTMAAHQICNIGTIGGNLVNAVPSADMPPILIALGARARIAGPDATRDVLLEDFFVGPGRTVLEPDEILTQIVLPDQPTTGSNYLKFGLRRAGALAVVGVASSVAMVGDVVSDVHIVLGAVGPVPVRARDAEATLRGSEATPELIAEVGTIAAAEARPITDVRGSEEYRRNLVDVLTRRSLAAAIERGHV
ncbi:MAG: xanthine dehydrogenase family protein subunit M [Actinobacteria bacterium]|nr:xanthine dehydrogenase family protein subunit M [Actinomycetota bacterium]